MIGACLTTKVRRIGCYVHTGSDGECVSDLIVRIWYLQGHLKTNMDPCIRKSIDAIPLPLPHPTDNVYSKTTGSPSSIAQLFADSPQPISYPLETLPTLPLSVREQ